MTEGASETTKPDAEVEAGEDKPLEQVAEPEGVSSIKKDEKDVTDAAALEDEPTPKDEPAPKDDPAPAPTEPTQLPPSAAPTPTVPEPTPPPPNDDSSTASTDKKSKKKKKKTKATAEPTADDATGEESVLVPDAPEREERIAEDTATSQPDDQPVLPREQEPVSPLNGNDPTPTASPITPEPTTSPAHDPTAALLAAQARLTALESSTSEELTHTRAQVTSLESTNTTQTTRIADLERRLSDAEHLAKERDDQLVALRSREAAAVLDAERVRGERDAEVRRLEREVEERLERQRERERGLEIEVNRLKQVRRGSSCCVVHSGLIGVQEHLEVVAAKEDSEAELTAIRDQHADLAREKERLEASHETLRTAHDDLTTSSQTTTSEMNTLRARLADADTALTKSTTRIHTLESSSAELERKRETLHAQLGKEMKRAEAAQTSREALLVENQGLLSQLEEMRERNGQVMKELVEVGEERDALVGSVGKLEVSTFVESGTRG